MLDTFKVRIKAIAKALDVNLSQKRIDALADRLHRKFPDLTEDADHDAKVNDLNDLIDFKEVAKEDDRLRTLENKAAKTEEKKESAKPEKTEEKANDNKDSDEAPAWAKALLEKVEKLEAEKQTASIQQKLMQHEKVKSLPQNALQVLLRGKALPKSDEELESFAQSLADDFTALQSELKPEGVIGGRRPVIGNSGTGEKKPSEKEVKSIVDKIM